jgi:hypothetical protein
MQPKVIAVLKILVVAVEDLGALLVMVAQV